MVCYKNTLAIIECLIDYIMKSEMIEQKNWKDKNINTLPAEAVPNKVGICFEVLRSHIPSLCPSYVWK